MLRMCSTCASADNMFNNPAFPLICGEMVFAFSERSNWSEYQKPSYWGFFEKCPAGRYRQQKCNNYSKMKMMDWLSSAFQRKTIFSLTVKGKLYIHIPNPEEHDLLWNTDAFLFVLYWSIHMFKIDEIPWTKAAEVSGAFFLPCALTHHHTAHLRTSHLPGSQK